MFSNVSKNINDHGFHLQMCKRMDFIQSLKVNKCMC